MKNEQKTIREMQQEMERQLLGPGAFLSINTRGRLHPEEPCPIRTCYQRDRDRILYSKAFRRLMHKTQVFIAPEGDHYRTRLTHTIEVSQIARTISRALMLNEDLTEAIALGHDLGHAPFGHAGESALNRLMKKHGGEGFHHSLQSLRVVDCLEKEGGLNLTYEVRNGILAHSKGKGDIKCRGLFAQPETQEAGVVRFADRLAYINHDIDDAIRARIISRDDIPEDLRKLFGEGISPRIHTMIMDIVRSSRDCPDITMSPGMLDGVNRLKDFLFKRVYTDSPAKAEEHKAFKLISHIFEHLIEKPDLVPGEIRRWSRAGGGSQDSDAPDDASEPVLRARAVCDFIAGMTDRYVIAFYKHLFLPRSWEVDFGYRGDQAR